MSSRALRKALKEKEQQEAAAEEEEGEPDDAPIPRAKKSAFELLSHEDEDEDGEEEDSSSSSPTRIEATPSVPKSSSKKKKKTKKRKNAKTDGITPPPTSTQTEQLEQLDEIDKALRQLSTTTTTATTTTTTNPASHDGDNETCRLLAIDTSHLHVQHEMRRLFGSAALDRQDPGPGPGPDDEPQHPHLAGNRRQQRRRLQPQHLGRAQQPLARPGPPAPAAAAGRRSAGRSAAVASRRRNIFVQGREEWPVATGGGGLAMDVEEKRRADGTVLYRFLHTRAYQHVQSQFDACVESMDPNRLVVLLQHNPDHVSTLLQVSEIAKQERDHATARHLLERALFSFGSALHSTFAENLARGQARLDFRRPENREFWLAAWRYMQNLSMRATWRTVYEWAKLLLSLSPHDDPYALWLILDQYALRSKQDLDYLNLSRNATFQALHQGMPNVQLSQGLAEYRSGNKSKGQQALFTAVARFPWVVARLMQELTIDPPPAIWGKEPRTERETLHTELYAVRAKDLWNTPETSALLIEVASALQPDMPTADPDTGAIMKTEARHVLLSDTPALIALLPRNLSAQLTSVSDPLPPTDDTPSYTPSTSATSPTPSRETLGTPAQAQRELQDLRSFFSGIFAWIRPTAPANADGHIDNEDEPAQAPSEEEIARFIQHSGLDHDMMVERLQRMAQLEAQVHGEGVYQARVGDAPDAAE